MDDQLSICQEYLLCAVGKNGTFASLDDRRTHFITGAIIDLVFSGCVTLEKDRLHMVGPLPQSLSHVTPLYQTISEREQAKGKTTLSNVFEMYILSSTEKNFMALFNSVGSSLSALGCADLDQGGLFKNKTLVRCRPEATDRVVQMIRAELLEDGPVSETTAALVTLLEKSGSIRQYFSDYEKAELKARLKELRAYPVAQMSSEVFKMIDEIVAAAIAVATLMMVSATTM